MWDTIERELLPDSAIIIHPGYGHGNEIENPVYTADFLRFITQIS